jgi:hypothetical protein
MCTAPAVAAPTIATPASAFKVTDTAAWLANAVPDAAAATPE